MSKRRTLSVAVLSVGVCACATGVAQAPVDYRGDGAPPMNRPTQTRGPAPIENRTPSTQAPPETPLPSGTPAQWEGEGVPLSAWALQPETAHPYDPRNPEPAHLVGQGETLYTIAAQRQVPLRALIDANALEPPFRLEEGQVLILPPPATHTVARGETLAAVARRYNVDLRSFVLLNRLQSPYTIRPGGRLILPAGARGPTEITPTAQPVAAAPTTQAPRTWAWPIQGRILVPFGPNDRGGRADAVEIASSAGASVQAAADGDVLFAGMGPPTLGGLVIIDHGGGVVTTLGFLTDFQVREGARVRRGQALASAEGDRVLFQVRRAGEATDPSPLLQRR